MNYTKSNIKMKKGLRADEVFYQIGKGIWIPFLILGFWFAYSGYSNYGEALACQIRRISGIPCPGCGGTRAVYYLFRGNLAESFRLHPAVLYGVGAYLQFMALCFYRKHIVGTWKEKRIRLEYYLYGTAAVILLQWAIKLLTIFIKLG